MRFRALLLLIVSSILLAALPPKANIAPPEGATKLLTSSIDSQDIAGVRIAFQQGANPNVGDQRSPMAHALNALCASSFSDAPDLASRELQKSKAQKNALSIIQFLFSKGAKLKNDPEELFMAVICKNKTAFEYLLSMGLNPHGLYKGYNLIELSFVYEADMNIPLLKKRGVPKIDPLVLPVLKLQRAVRSFDVKELGRLIQNEKTDVNQYDPSGRTVLIEILDGPSWLYDPGMLLAVLDAHPDWNLPSKNEEDFGRYPLHFATFGLGHDNPEQISLVARLVGIAIQTMGANPNVTDELRNSPLHNAAKGGALPVITALLQYGADPLATDIRFRRPSQVATDPNVISLLKEAEKAVPK